MTARRAAQSPGDSTAQGGRGTGCTMTSGGPDSPLRRRLARVAAAAARAPSKHNTQPWRFFVHADALEVWPDPARLLTATDPHQRELVLSCGAAAETARVLAVADGLEVAVEVMPEGRAGALVRLQVHGTRVATPRETALAGAVAERHTDRGPLDASTLPVQTPFLLQEAASRAGATLFLVTTGGGNRTLGRLLLEADHGLAGRRFAAQELQAWSRPDGSTAGDGVPSTSSRGSRASYSSAFVQRDFCLPGSRGDHDRPGPDRPLIAVLTTTTDTRADWVTAGRALVDVLLELSLLGGTASYLNQVLEVPVTRSSLRRELALPGWPQLVLRIGAGGPVVRTRRRPADDAVVQVQ